MSNFSRTDPGRFSAPAIWEAKIPIEGHGPQHIGILANFVAAILDRTPLIAPAEEGIHALELANAFLLSNLEDRTIDKLPDGFCLVCETSESAHQLIRPKKAENRQEISDDMKPAPSG